MLYWNVQSKMMRGSERESMKKGIFKPQCLFSFRREVAVRACACAGACACARVCARVCVIRVPSLSSFKVLLEHQSQLSAALGQIQRQFPLVVIAMIFIV